MKYLVLDCETSGLPDFAQPADAPGQPHLASIAMIVADENGVMLREHNCLIRPDDWEMDPKATAVNGLTTEYLRKHGVPIYDVLQTYSQLILAGCVFTAYNSQFDAKMMRGALRRAGLPDLFEQTPTICLMRACTPICKVPRAKGTGFKFPKLEEACRHFGFAQTGAHSAMGDAQSALMILQSLIQSKQLPAPEVHYSKKTP